jgi:glycosyltransferase involved in cell wall biosynthesis
MILSVGSLLPHPSRKGHDLLIRAFHRVSKTHHTWALKVVGDGPGKATLMQLCEDLGIGDKVEFVGRTADVTPWMARCSIFVLPSIFEGFPNVLVEAMGMGAAVISTACPHGPSEIITHDVDGLLIPVNDVETMSSAILQLINAPTKRALMGLQAQAVRDRFAAKTVMPAWERALFPSALPNSPIGR